MLKCTDPRKLMVLYSLIFDFEEKIPMSNDRVDWLSEAKKVLRN